MDTGTKEMKRRRWWLGSKRGQWSGALGEMVPNLGRGEKGRNRENTGGQRELREY